MIRLLNAECFHSFSFTSKVPDGLKTLDGLIILERGIKRVFNKWITVTIERHHAFTSKNMHKAGNVAGHNPVII